MSYGVDDTTCADMHVTSYELCGYPLRCEACERLIVPGLRFAVSDTVYEGERYKVVRCGACELIHKHLREKDPERLYPKEKLDCKRGYQEEWGHEPPPEIQALAFVSPAEASARLEALMALPDYRADWYDERTGYEFDCPICEITAFTVRECDSIPDDERTECECEAPIDFRDLSVTLRDGKRYRANLSTALLASNRPLELVAKEATP